MVSIDDSPTEFKLTDQAMAKVAGADACKQGPNGLATGWNRAGVTQTVKAVERIAAGWAENTNAVKVLRVLCELAQEEPERLNPDLDHDVWGFEASDIGERLLERFRTSGAIDWSEDPEKARRRMKGYWTKLLETWDRQWPTIADGIGVTGNHLRPSPVLQEGGGTGKKNRYGFKFDTQDSPQNQASPPDLDLLNIPPIRCQLHDISGNRLVRWMSNRGFSLGGWGGAALSRRGPAAYRCCRTLDLAVTARH